MSSPRAERSRSCRSHGRAGPSACMARRARKSSSRRHTRLETTVEIEFVPGPGITTSTITVRGHIHGISNDEFQKLAKEAEEGCPVSKAMHGNVELRLHATLDVAH